MNAHINPDKIAQLLNQGSRQLDEKIVAALSDARRRALSRQAQAPSIIRTTGLWIGHHLMPHNTRQWLATSLLAALLVVTGTTIWQYNEEQQVSEIDVAILADEMPLDVFVN